MRDVGTAQDERAALLDACGPVVASIVAGLDLERQALVVEGRDLSDPLAVKGRALSETLVLAIEVYPDFLVRLCARNVELDRLDGRGAAAVSPALGPAVESVVGRVMAKLPDARVRTTVEGIHGGSRVVVLVEPACGAIRVLLVGPREELGAKFVGDFLGSIDDAPTRGH